MIIKDVWISAQVEEKIDRKHGVKAEEVLEVFWNEYDKPLIRRSDRGPKTYLVYGRTEAGRYLFVPFILNPEGKADVLTARDMDIAERRLYKRR